MKPEAKEWIGRAKEDLETAEYCLKGTKVDAAALFAQQAAEKALKALGIETQGSFEKTHELLALGRKVGIPNEYYDACEELSAAYIATRYPDTPGRPSEAEAAALVESARKVIGWVESKLA